MKCAISTEQVFEFKESYFYKANLIQKYYTKPSSDFRVALIDNLFPYQFKGDIVPSVYSDIISLQNNLTTIILAIFIL